MPLPPDPIGVILAGGRGARIGGSKATVLLQGKPLIWYPLEAVRSALGEVVIISKADTELPSLPGVTVWIEPQAPRHPLVGIMNALALADGRAVVVCAADLPFVTPEVVRRIARADPGQAPAVVASTGRRMQPLLACYQQRALELLQGAGRPVDAPLQEAIAALGPRLFEIADADLLFNVNTPDDLLQASAMLDRRRSSQIPRVGSPKRH